MLDNTILALSAPILTLTLLYFYRPGSKARRIPPGPPSLPIIGNKLPPGNIWDTFTEYGREYGDLFSLKLLGTPVVVINSAQVAHDLIEVKSACYWRRIPAKMIELCGFNHGALFEPDPAKWRDGRRMLATTLQSREIPKLRPLCHKYVVMFLGSLLESPENFREHIRTIAPGVLLEIAYGYSITGVDDPILKDAEKLVRLFSEVSSLTPGEAYVCNWLPIVAKLPRWFPGTSFFKVAEKYKEYGDGLVDKLLNKVKKEMKNGTARESLVTRALTDPEPIDEYIIAHNAAQMISGGADTSASVLSSIFLALTQHPDVQKKAQAEIDAVIGPGRLPSVADRPDLPYVEAVLREVVRCYPIVPVVKRNPTEDDTYKGYDISKDTTILVHFWGIMHNEKAFPDPYTFDPERWIRNPVTEKVNDPLEILFGFGRRACPGKWLAPEMVFTPMVATLAAFDILRAKDENGNEIVPPGGSTRGGIVAPLPFPCRIVPRSEKSRQLVLDAVNAL